MDPHTMSAQERAALAMWLLMQRPHTTAGIARRVGLTNRGARYLLVNMSRVVPMFRDKKRGIWQICK